ncbi:MAG: bifunctional phosphopantothenoylcysteine decarboxylase/phosphopantothenate--cysteine ligase CoaBC [Methanomassiliicoccales archaeon]|nr:bifunctional phosphopantothenoylcysteine decarboxylase/phosphopantothenate--cysteine ligase CoaBC [Methanomassiliicoccales archaeon]
MHPSESLRGSSSKALSGKRIVLGITGSIAAVECFELARELIRHGANVQAVMSEEAMNLVTPWAMEFATGNEVIDVIDGRVQHVSLFGNVPDRADLLLIAPCTANTISKIACGIDDTPVTTMATTALGSKVPIIIAPAMHLTMFTNPIIQQNVEKLKQFGVEFLGPRVEGKKAKIADNAEIVTAVQRRLGKNDFQGKRVLVIGGSSEERIDEMRVITNRGTGETAVELARAAYLRGGDVELWMGRCSVPLPAYLPTKRFTTVESLLEMVPAIDQEIVLVPAALADYAPKPQPGKIPSGRKELVLNLKAVPKVLEAIRKKKVKLIAFKAEHGVGEAELVERASSRLNSVPLEMIVANDLHDVKPGETKVIMLRQGGRRSKACGSKASVANDVLDEVLKIE